MNTTETTLKKVQIFEVLNFLQSERGFDFKPYRISMLGRRIDSRIKTTNSHTFQDYLVYLKKDPRELDKLIDAFTINVSRFFRNNLVFELFRTSILKEILINKQKLQDDQIRVWSAGTASGEEAYSIAMILDEFKQREKLNFDLKIFGTDIDSKSLQNAIGGLFNSETLRNVKLHQLEKYFTKEDGFYCCNEKLQSMVDFSAFNLLDQKRSSPPRSIFGSFDVIFCRNVLIYIDIAYQEAIFEKFYKVLQPGGFLILGESEVPVTSFKNKFKRYNKCCKIYQKV